MSLKHEIRHDQLAERIYDLASKKELLSRRVVKRVVKDNLNLWKKDQAKIQEFSNQATGYKKFINSLIRYVKILPSRSEIKNKYKDTYIYWTTYNEISEGKIPFKDKYLLREDHLVLVKKYEHDFNWSADEVKTAKRFIDISKKARAFRGLRNRAFALLGFIVSSIAAILIGITICINSNLTKKKAAYFAQVAETKIEQDSLFLAYKLTEEALHLVPKNNLYQSQKDSIIDLMPDWFESSIIPQNSYLVNDQILISTAISKDKKRSIKVLNLNNLTEHKLYQEPVSKYRDSIGISIFGNDSLSQIAWQTANRQTLYLGKRNEVGRFDVVDSISLKKIIRRSNDYSLPNIEGCFFSEGMNTVFLFAKFRNQVNLYKLSKDRDKGNDWRVIEKRLLGDERMSYAVNSLGGNSFRIAYSNTRGASINLLRINTEGKVQDSRWTLPSDEKFSFRKFSFSINGNVLFLTAGIAKPLFRYTQEGYEFKFRQFAINLNEQYPELHEFKGLSLLHHNKLNELPINTFCTTNSGSLATAHIDTNKNVVLTFFGPNETTIVSPGLSSKKGQYGPKTQYSLLNRGMSMFSDDGKYFLFLEKMNTLAVVDIVGESKGRVRRFPIEPATYKVGDYTHIRGEKSFGYYRNILVSRQTDRKTAFYTLDKSAVIPRDTIINASFVGTDPHRFRVFLEIKDTLFTLAMIDQEISLIDTVLAPDNASKWEISIPASREVPALLVTAMYSREKNPFAHGQKLYSHGIGSRVLREHADSKITILEFHKSGSVYFSRSRGKKHQTNVVKLLKPGQSPEIHQSNLKNVTEWRRGEKERFGIE